jgi:hypothetical protein
MDASKRIREKAILVFLSDAERQLLKDKATYLGINMSEYIRKMITDGCIINYQVADSVKLIKEVNRIGVNLNQIAKHANETGGRYNQRSETEEGEEVTLTEIKKKSEIETEWEEARKKALAEASHAKRAEKDFIAEFVFDGDHKAKEIGRAGRESVAAPQQKAAPRASKEGQLPSPERALLFPEGA